MTDCRSSREELLERINTASFAMNDTNLFLDTHPKCQEAMEYFEKMKELRNTALGEYARLYGPLTIDTASGQTEDWQWIHFPWPWQEGGC